MIASPRPRTEPRWWAQWVRGGALFLAILGLAATTGSVAYAWRGDQASEMGADQALRVIADRSIDESLRRTAQGAAYLRASQVIRELQRSATGADKAADDARIYLRRLHEQVNR